MVSLNPFAPRSGKGRDRHRAELYAARKSAMASRGECLRLRRALADASVCARSLGPDGQKLAAAMWAQLDGGR